MKQNMSHHHRRAQVLVSLLAVPLVFSSGVALADDLSIVPAEPSITIPTLVTETVTTAGDSLLKIKATGARLIADRTHALNKLKAKIQSSKLTIEQKSTLIAKIDDRVVKLNALAGTIKTGTDASSTKQEVNSIFTDYRIFAVFIPQINFDWDILALNNYTVKLPVVFAKIQSNIDTAKAKGQDVTARQASLNKANSLLADANSKLDGLPAKVDALTPSDYPTNSQAVFQATKTTIQAVQADLKQIRSVKIKKAN